MRHDVGIEHSEGKQVAHRSARPEEGDSRTRGEKQSKSLATDETRIEHG